jgi:uncharacterized SAM-binding protein YcdF (DUF218 family)
MQCPFCDHLRTYKHGRTAKGSQKFFCPACQNVFAYRYPKKHQRLHVNNRLLRATIPILTGALILMSPIGAGLITGGLIWPLPHDSGQPVDAIVILGRGEKLRDGRVAIAAELGRLRRAPRFFVSGMGDAHEIIDLLKQTAAPGQILEGERCSGTTEENALFTTAILYPQGVRHIILVTDSPHMLRSWLVFRSFGFKVIPHPSSIPLNVGAREQLMIALREYVGLISYFIQGKFHVRSRHDLEHPPKEVEQRIVSWNCKVLQPASNSASNSWSVK